MDLGRKDISSEELVFIQEIEVGSRTKVGSGKKIDLGRSHTLYVFLSKIWPSSSDDELDEKLI